MRIAVNIAVFYAAWVGCVLAAASNRPFAATAACTTAVLFHLLLASQRRVEAAFVGSGLLLGVAVESILLNFGLASYAAPGPISSLPPVWLLLLWAVFSTTINVSLSWLKSRLGLAAVLGAIGGPFSYALGERLGAMALADPQWLGFVTIGLLWAVAFPLLLAIARRLDQMRVSF
jgi:hypothetical protein